MDKKNEIRTRLYNELLAKWKNSNYLGFARFSPGAGKSKFMVDIIKDHINRTTNPRVRVLVSSRVLRDRTFIKEIDKWWDVKEFNKYCEVVCYQSQMNIKEEHYTLGIADEGDIMLSTRHLEGYTNNTWDEFINLSGTYTPDKLEIAKQLFGEILVDYPMSKAMEESLINKVNVILYPVPLLKKNDIPIGKGYWSESKQMEWIDNKITSLRIKIDTLYKKLDKDFDQVLYDELKFLRKEKERFESGYMSSSRMNILYSLKSTIDVSKKLVRELAIDGNKVLVFSERVKNIEEICKYTYHGSKPESILDRFEQGEFNVLGVSKKIERGENFSRLNHGIFQSFNSSHSSGIQRVGRLARLPVEEIANAHFIISYYNNKHGKMIKAQNYKWFKNVVEGLGIDYIVDKKFM